ncbi:MAG: arginase family protein [Deltaproteobacteria bacterium]|nr:arginase family protein [Deltaproteobacteria bacterium]
MLQFEPALYCISHFDVVEVIPAYDPSQITSLLAANIAYEFISLIPACKVADPELDYWGILINHPTPNSTRKTAFQLICEYLMCIYRNS